MPVRDEAKRIGTCLAALSCQTTPAGRVVLLLNNCTDGTAEVIKELPPGPHQLHIVECRLGGPSASAGVARSLAMDFAAREVAYGRLLDSPNGFRLPRELLAAFERPYEVFLSHE
jgi:hypothetical protein